MYLQFFNVGVDSGPQRSLCIRLKGAAENEAQEACKALEGPDQGGHQIAVYVARPRGDRPPGGGEFNRGGGRR